MRTGTLPITATVLAAVALAACGPSSDGTVAPAPTATVTETVTVAPSESSPTGTPTGTASAAVDACAQPGLDSQAFIFVTSPVVGASFSPGDVVEGCSNVFEATYQWELLDGSQTVLDSGFGTASCGTGCVGAFSFTPTFSVSSTQVGTVRVFASSAKDGSDEHVNLIPVLLQP